LANDKNNLETFVATEKDLHKSLQNITIVFRKDVICKLRTWW